MLRFHVRPETFTICRLRRPEDALAAPDAALVSVVRDEGGWSAVLPASRVPDDATHDGSWRALSLHGPFPFTAVGILEQVLAPLAAAKVPVLAFSSFDTDHVLVPADRLDDALDAMAEAGHAQTAGADDGGISAIR